MTAATPKSSSPRQQASSRSPEFIADIAVAGCVAIVLTYYLWLASLGQWTRLPPSTGWHGQLATAFLHGQLALIQKPTAQLLSVEDPYDAQQLTGVEYPLDYSLYKGKFYPYFGPVPALLIAPTQYVLRKEIGDAWPAFAFIAALLVVQSILVAKIWKRFFLSWTIWPLAAAVLALGLAVPSVWLLAAPHWSVVAAMGGAFFFVSGLSAAFDAFVLRKAVYSRLLATGGLWAAAVGTRVTFAPAVAMLVLLAIWAMRTPQTKKEHFSQAIRGVFALILPLGMGIGLLAWYNWARFDSPFETGLRYQLNPQSMALLFRDASGGHYSTFYVIHNLFNYFLRPPSPHGVFPFLDLQPAWRGPLIPSLAPPSSYHPEWIAGLLWTSPIILCAPLSIWAACRSQMLHHEQGSVGLGGVVLALWVSVLAGMGVIMPFFWAAMRYTADFVYPLYIVSTVGFWYAMRAAGAKRSARATATVLSLGLIAVTIFVGNLLAIGQAHAAFDRATPGLWDRMLQLTGGDLRRLRPDLWARFRAMFGP